MAIYEYDNIFGLTYGYMFKTSKGETSNNIFAVCRAVTKKLWQEDDNGDFYVDHHGLLIVMSGYGDSNGIFAGDGEYIKYKSIIKAFKNLEYEELYDIPIAMFVDTVNIPNIPINYSKYKDVPKLSSIIVNVSPSSGKGVKFSEIISVVMRKQFSLNKKDTK